MSQSKKQVSLSLFHLEEKMAGLLKSQLLTAADCLIQKPDPSTFTFEIKSTYAMCPENGWQPVPLEPDGQTPAQTPPVSVDVKLHVTIPVLLLMTGRTRACLDLLETGAPSGGSADNMLQLSFTTSQNYSVVISSDDVLIFYEERFFPATDQKVSGWRLLTLYPDSAPSYEDLAEFALQVQKNIAAGRTAVPPAPVSEHTEEDSAADPSPATLEELFGPDLYGQQLGPQAWVMKCLLEGLYYDEDHAEAHLNYLMNLYPGLYGDLGLGLDCDQDLPDLFWANPFVYSLAFLNRLYETRPDRFTRTDLYNGLGNWVRSRLAEGLNKPSWIMAKIQGECHSVLQKVNPEDRVITLALLTVVILTWKSSCDLFSAERRPSFLVDKAEKRKERFYTAFTQIMEEEMLRAAEAYNNMAPANAAPALTQTQIAENLDEILHEDQLLPFLRKKILHLDVIQVPFAAFRQCRYGSFYKEPKEAVVLGSIFTDENECTWEKRLEEALIRGSLQLRVVIPEPGHLYDYQKTVLANAGEEKLQVLRQIGVFPQEVLPQAIDYARQQGFHRVIPLLLSWKT